MGGFSGSGQCPPVTLNHPAVQSGPRQTGGSASGPIEIPGADKQHALLRRSGGEKKRVPDRAAAAAGPSYDTTKVLKIPALRPCRAQADRYYRGGCELHGDTCNFVNNDISPDSRATSKIPACGVSICQKVAGERKRERKKEEWTRNMDVHEH
ncbi:hypothetical protein K0M31_003060 [Melipona bicolor]|uniref:Uncharacterized protein n=1 Tax=Melipona bicolor TaxID=60889 RepID=A0AA40G0B6_9HYME|nr:hypothetical protein K0M31_003060 [Melipona bicolor]